MGIAAFVLLNFAKCDNDKKPHAKPEPSPGLVKAEKILSDTLMCRIQYTEAELARLKKYRWVKIHRVSASEPIHQQNPPQ